MKDFFTFLETMANEMSFIRNFFFSKGDLTTLLVFADWLQEKEDSREELVRLAVASNLKGNRKCRELGMMYKINALYSDPTRKYAMLNHEDDINFDEKDFKWFTLYRPFGFDSDPELKEIPLEEVPEGKLYKFFWGILAWGLEN